MKQPTRPLVAVPLIRQALLRYWHDSKVSQEEVAARFGISRRELQYLLQGRHQPKGELCLIILAWLGRKEAVSIITQVQQRVVSLALPLVLLPECGGLALA